MPETQRTALDLVRSRILDSLVSVCRETPVADALRVARSSELLRLPVTESGRAVGSIDRYTLEALAPEEGALSVQHAMSPPMPEVDESASEAEVSRLLGTFTEVLVTREGFPLGLLRRRDLQVWG
jgi:predicted transcriptional regulator